jgi:hypothetical protein
MEDQILREQLQREKSKIKGAFATMQGLLLSLYCLTIAKWINPPLYDMAWRIANLSNTPERICSGVLERESSQEANSEWTEDPKAPGTENEQ